MSLHAIERTTYRDMYAVDQYRDAHSPGERYADLFASLATPGSSVLDAGCGSGKGLRALQSRGFRVFGCDLTLDAMPDESPSIEACLWHPRDVQSVAYAAMLGGMIPDMRPSIDREWTDVVRDMKQRHKDGEQPSLTPRFDYAYCTDVLEHVPPTFTMLAVQNLLNVVTKGAFFSISLVPDAHGVWVGKALHQTVQTFTAWREQLGELGTVTDARDLGGVGLYWVTPR